jgi:hypothetical protein
MGGRSANHSIKGRFAESCAFGSGGPPAEERQPARADDPERDPVRIEDGDERAEEIEASRLAPLLVSGYRPPD